MTTIGSVFALYRNGQKQHIIVEVFGETETEKKEEEEEARIANTIPTFYDVVKKWKQWMMQLKKETRPPSDYLMCIL